ncbi:hypothetical protein BH11MYX3_BH11MYX3_15700 [soil metagenome]
MQLASSFTARRLVVAMTTCSAAFVLYRAWPAPVVTSPRTPAPTYHYVPMVGDPTYSLEDAANSGRGGCVPWIEPLVAHPNWSLLLVDGVSGCTGDWIHNTFEVRSDGSVIWTAEGMPPRGLQLHPDELAVITGMDHIDCGRTDDVGYTFGWMRVAPAGDPEGHAGAVIPQSSMLGVVLAGVVSRAIDRYRDWRIADIGTFEVHLTLRVEGLRGQYRIDLDSRGQLTVRHGSHQLSRRQLDDAERIDVLDHLKSHNNAVSDADTDTAHGFLVAEGARVPLAVSRWERSYTIVWRTFDDALYVESQR